MKEIFLDIKEESFLSHIFATYRNNFKKRLMTN